MSALTTFDSKAQTCQFCSIKTLRTMAEGDIKLSRRGWTHFTMLCSYCMDSPLSRACACERSQRVANRVAAATSVVRGLRLYDAMTDGVHVLYSADGDEYDAVLARWKEDWCLAGDCEDAVELLL